MKTLQEQYNLIKEGKGPRALRSRVVGRAHAPARRGFSNHERDEAEEAAVAGAPRRRRAGGGAPGAGGGRAACRSCGVECSASRCGRGFEGSARSRGRRIEAAVLEVVGLGKVTC